MDKTYHIEMPYLLAGDALCRLMIFDEQLYGSDDHFIRLDLYPLIAPSHMRRHYGWWDIPLKHIKQERINFIFDFKRRKIRLDNQRIPLEIMQGWRGPVEEDGYCMLHISLWDKSKEPPHMMEVRSRALVLATRSTDLPLKQINIPVTDRCNLKCTMCPRQNTEELIEVDIPDDALQSLLRTSRDLSGILLQGLGEPLLYKNICDVIKQLKREMRKDSEVGLTTNATMLNEETAMKLLDSGLNFLYFSVDAATKPTYEAIRVGADFDAVVKNIIRCVEYRCTLGANKPRFMMNFVITQQNCYEIAAFARLARELGIENVTYSHCLGAQSGKMELVNKAELESQFKAAIGIAAEKGFNIYPPPLERTKEEKCFFMERAVILAQGHVIPCHAMAPGYSAKGKTRIFGNVREKALQDIWDQADYREFSHRVLTGDFPAECTGCECKAYLVP
ncbi:MAG: radical SAM protein [Nitrospirales bacterium]|nr:MAG: radical SAM protein [Nitrospirales bacterium]